MGIHVVKKRGHSDECLRFGENLYNNEHLLCEEKGEIDTLVKKLYIDGY